MNRRSIFHALAACLPAFMGGAAFAKSSGFATGGVVRSPIEKSADLVMVRMEPLKSGPFEAAYDFGDEIPFRYGEDGLTRMKLLSFIDRLEVATKALEEEIGTMSIHVGRGWHVDAQALAFIALDAIEKAEFKVIK